MNREEEAKDDWGVRNNLNNEVTLKTDSLRGNNGHLILCCIKIPHYTLWVNELINCLNISSFYSSFP